MICTPHRVRARQRVFLAAFAEQGSISHAAAAAGISRQTHYRWLRESPQYRERFEDARDEAVDALEAEARRRAVEGVEQPIYRKGKQVGTVRRYSDLLLIFLLKALKPEKYRDNYRPRNASADALDVLGTTEEQQERIDATVKQLRERLGYALPADGIFKPLV